MNPKVSSILLVVLTLIAFILMCIILSSSSGVYSGDIGCSSISIGCGLINGHCSGFHCDGTGFFKAVSAAFGIGGILFISIVMVIHILQLVGVFQKCVPEKFHQYVKFMHACAASTLFTAEICLVIYYATVSCSAWRINVNQYCDVDKSVGFAMFLIPVVCLFNLGCFFICFTPGMECQNGCQPLI